jgi:hypothetical protein
VIFAPASSPRSASLRSATFPLQGRVKDMVRA